MKIKDNKNKLNKSICHSSKKSSLVSTIGWYKVIKNKFTQEIYMHVLMYNI